MPDLALGPFHLHRPIAEGGMGQVWAGRHDDTPVAVKVLTGGAAWDPSYRAMFRNEVRAAAQLDHPGIIAVLDHGEIPASVTEATRGHLVAGSPYLVMEYASGGRLSRKHMHWQRLRHLLTHLLDALGHAHARGVVHRDLKPSNILLAGRDDLRGGAKLSDFGIAWVGKGDQPVDAAFAGTLQYMAPEQHAGETHAYGPWTDLYALGSVAWWLVSGRTPFHAYGGRAVARAHWFQSPPPLAPRFPIPDGLEAWLRVLLHKEPTARFACAADAAAALAALDDSELPASADAFDDDREQPTLLQGRTGSAPSTSSVSRTGTATGVTGTGGLGDRIATDEAPVGPPPDEEAPDVVARLPMDWRVGEPHVPVALRGAGLGLFDLRDPPLVGREAPRDQMWRALRACDRTGRARVVWLRGPAGVGKSRLARWLVQRANETIGAPGWFVADDDLDDTVAAWLGVERMAADDRADAIADRLRRCPLPALASAVAQALDPDAGLAPRERLGAFRSLLEVATAERPGVLVVDDAELCDASLALAEQVVTAPQVGRRAVVVVLVSRDDRLAAQPEARERIEAVLAASRSPKRVELGPLDDDDQHALLDHMGLAGALSARVAARARGNPMFAVQLVGDWVERDLLVLGPDGFVLDGPEPPVPASLSEVWRDRMEQLLQPFPEEVGHWLEQAAVWGLEVHDESWHALCGLDDDEQAVADLLVARMLDARLAEETPDGWRFAHALLRSGVLARADDRRRARWHARAAEHLATTGADPARRGMHLLAAGRAIEAVDALLEGFDPAMERHGPEAAQRIHLPCTQAMDAALPPDDPRWATLWRQRSALRLADGDLDDARSWAEAAVQHAEDRDLDRFTHASLHLASLVEREGRLDQALHRLKRATARRLREGRRDQQLATLLSRMGRLARATGALADAEQWSTQALALLYRHDAPPRAIGAALMDQAIHAAHAGARARAHTHYDEAQPDHTPPGTQLQQAYLQNNRSDALMKLGRLDEALVGFERAAEAIEALGDDAVVSRLNSALVHLRTDDPHAAAEALHRVREPRAGRSAMFTALVDLALAAVAAQTGDADTCAQLLTPAAEVVRQGGMVDRDLLWLYARIGRSSEGPLAQMAWHLAREQAARLGDSAALAEAARHLDEQG
jgi:serine/threonine protein kinase/tetratricopeptide (TPR) repeat protein